MKGTEPRMGAVYPGGWRHPATDSEPAAPRRLARVPPILPDRPAIPRGPHRHRPADRLRKAPGSTNSRSLVRILIPQQTDQQRRS